MYCLSARYQQPQRRPIRALHGRVPHWHLLTWGDIRVHSLPCWNLSVPGWPSLLHRLVSVRVGVGVRVRVSAPAHFIAGHGSAKANFEG